MAEEEELDKNKCIRPREQARGQKRKDTGPEVSLRYPIWH